MVRNAGAGELLKEEVVECMEVAGDACGGALVRTGIGRDNSVPGAGHGLARNATGWRKP